MRFSASIGAQSKRSYGNGNGSRTSKKKTKPALSGLYYIHCKLVLSGITNRDHIFFAGVLGRPWFNLALYLGSPWQVPLRKRGRSIFKLFAKQFGVNTFHRRRRYA